MATLAPARVLHTTADLERLSAQGGHYELIQGELVEMAPPGSEHGFVTLSLAARVAVYVQDNNLGMTFAAETGVLVSRNPDTVLAPDMAFVAKGRLSLPLPKSYTPVVPDLVLETRSPHDRPRAVAEKVARWLALGVLLVWELDPASRVLTVYRPDAPPQALGASDTLTGEPVLPGFTLSLARLLAPEDAEG